MDRNKEKTRVVSLQAGWGTPKSKKSQNTIYQAFQECQKLIDEGNPAQTAYEQISTKYHYKPGAFRLAFIKQSPNDIIYA